MPTVNPDLLKSLEWRCIGPHRGGRVVAVAGHPTERETFYFGSTGGGVWKTADAGVTWRNVSDGFFKRASVGAIAVAPSDPNVIYAGMGECCIRSNVSHGDGVYRSTDGGKTWTHLGLEATQNIARERVHPENPDLVYVAALGHVYGPNPDRGVYRSRDGGKTWERILFKNEQTGAIDLVMDPTNPRILYTAFWDAQRMPHGLRSGGPGSSLYKSTDGGDTWVELTRNPGLPKGLWGRVGMALSPARPDRIWAMIEAEGGGCFRSDDGGATWEKVSEEGNLRQRPWYYMHIVADPADAETVYVLNVQLWRSHDGGRTFRDMPSPHVDHHDLWIDPQDPRRMILGCDGGACVSFNAGLSWSTLYNQPTAEFYHVTTDNRFPYRVYGAQQDNTTMSVPSRSDAGPITQAEWYEIGGGESGYIAVRPDDPDVVYAGSYQGYLTRYNRRTRQKRDISVWPEYGLGAGAKDLKYRFQWTFPIVISPHDPNVLYVTGNHVFRSTDEGHSWEVISPDLTRNDPSKLEPSGGPITRDNTGAEYYCTIFTFAESPLERGLLWAGSDDGLIHVSRDGGKTWENVTPADLPEWALVSIIEPSPHDAATAYVAATRYKHDDFRPYLYRTNDYGRTWGKITEGIAENHFTRVIREDPGRRGLLYAGTEVGIYVSFDGGASWQPLGGNFPVVPVHDLAIRDNELVVATHGRSFWILDDVTLLHQLADGLPEAPARLFRPRDTVRWRSGAPPWASIDLKDYTEANKYAPSGGIVTTYALKKKPDGKIEPVYLDCGQNPPEGVIVHYFLKEKPTAEITLSFLDADGKLLREFKSKPEEPAKAEGEPSGGAGETAAAAGSGEAKQDEEKKDTEPRIPAEAGLNRFAWNLRLPGPSKIDGAVLWGQDVPGPAVPPGRYQVRLQVGDQTWTQPFGLIADPRLEGAQADLEEQFRLASQVRDKLSETHDAINRIRGIRRQVEEWERRVKDRPEAETVKRAAAALKPKLAAIEEELIQVKARARQDNLNYPIKLNAKLAVLMGAIGSSDTRPTRQAYEVFEVLSGAVDRQLEALRAVEAEELKAFNEVIRETGVPAVVPAAAAAAKAATR